MALGISFALRGLKAASGQNDKSFVSMNKIDSRFKTMEKSHANRLVLYINLSTDNLRVSHTEHKLFSEIKDHMLDVFSNGDALSIAPFDDKNYIVFAAMDIETIRKSTDSYLNEVNKILIKYGVFNIVSVVIGLFDATGLHINFDVATERAKQACMLAKSQKSSYAEWSASGGKALEKKIKIENNIEKEIDNNRFFLEYQPVLDAKTKRIIGAEVLSRLNSESEGILQPRLLGLLS